MFSALTAVKFVASGLVGAGTGKIVGRIIKNNITPETFYEKVTVAAAAFVIGTMAAKATKEYTDEMIDEAAEFATDAVNKIKNAGKLAKINKQESSFIDEDLDPDDFEIDPETDHWVAKKVEEPSIKDRIAELDKALDELMKAAGVKL